MSSITLGLSFNVMNCCSCGIAYAVPEDFDGRRRKDARSFYCPNGHSQSYGDSEADKLRAEIKQQHLLVQQSLNRERSLTDNLAKSKAAERKLAKRIAGGVCPVPNCKRHFTNLQRHITSQHKGVAIPLEGNEQRLLR